MSHRRQRGFTLLEVLIAVAVLGMVVLLCDQGIAYALRATTLQAQVKERHGDLGEIDVALRRILAFADPGQYPEPATLRGTASTLALTTELPLQTDGQLQRVAATLSAADGRLLLTWRRLRHVEGSTAPAQTMVILTGVRRLELGYFARGGDAWTASWARDTLPALVRLQIVFDDARHWPPIIAAPLREPLQQ